MTASTSSRDKRERRQRASALRKRRAEREQRSLTIVPLWARVLRQVAIWGGAAVLAVGTFVGATITAEGFLDEQDKEDPLTVAAEAIDAGASQRVC
ncbi:hypothetical protein [Phytoactinopolyspora endophytica]|uniref:hypothetical protein n=1 Tax=Phytoactinopolyspora endophytica TaxID=1642495 RepID=UPI00101DBC3D|nr:hypothetical protein [Phytoactinopolyspora endophytica]